MRIFEKLFFSLLIICQTGNSSAHAADEQINFEQVADAAFLNSPALGRLKNRILQQKADAVALGMLDNPEVSAETRPYVSDANGNEVEYEISLSQPLKLSYFGKRGSVSELMKSAVSIEEKLALNELQQSMLLLYGKVWAIQQKEAFLISAEKRLNVMYQRVSDKKQGLFPQSTIGLFEASMLQLSGQLLSIKADQSRALAAITNQTSQKYKAKKFQTLNLKPVADIDSLNVSAEGIPVSDRIKLRSKIAEKQAELARLDAFPKLAPRISFEHVDNGTDRVNLGITMELPFFNRNQAERIRAEGGLNEQIAARQYFESGGLQEEVNLLLSSALASEKQAALYRDKILPVLNKSLSAAENEFNAGQGNPFQIWQIISELIESQNSYLEFWVMSLSDRTALSVLYGKEI